MISVAVSSTPDRVQSDILSRWPDIPAVRDAYPLISSIPRSLIAPSTPSHTTSMKMVLSPSPLPVSQVPSSVFPEISPPSQGSGSTPFERQFINDFSQEWSDINTQVSPVLRREPFSPSIPDAGVSPFEADYGPTSQDLQGAIERVSLIDKFISAAADESVTTVGSIRISTFPSQDRSSPLSDLSDLSSLSSSDEFDVQTSSPSTSPVTEKHIEFGQSNVQPSSLGRLATPSQLTRGTTCSHDMDYQPAKGTTGRKRKGTLQSRDGNEIQITHKRRRFASSPESPPTDTSSSLGTLTHRRLPTNVQCHPQFSLLYLRFPVSSYLRLADRNFPLRPHNSKRPVGTYNEPRDALDLYTPRFVKGCGTTKVGLCPICIESPSRGGKGETVWFSMKFSAYKVVYLTAESLTRNVPSYHLQYAHGISSVSGRPFSPPTAFRTITRQNPAKGERSNIQEGKCHKCKKWVIVESIKNMDIKVKELYWWKHAAVCHQATHIDGDDDFFLDDEIYRRVQQVL